MRPSVIGIIAEYNPFHNGHARQIQLAREQLGPVPVIAVMSGNLTQRGELSLLDKWQRTKLALLGGVDLVLELPVTYVLQSAQHFAEGGVTLLAKTGIITHLSFGCETDDFSLLRQLAEENFTHAALQQALNSGVSYAKALEALATAKNPAYCPLLQGSNNLLALEYWKALQRFPEITALPVARQGVAYNATELTANFPSASAIRQELLKMSCTEAVLRNLPPACRPVFQQYWKQKKNSYPASALSLLLSYTLEKTRPHAIASAAQVSEGLENIFWKNRRAQSIEDFIQRCVTRRYAPSRIRRLLWQVLLSDDKVSFKNTAAQPPQYFRILGFTQKGQQLLQQIKKEGALPLLSNIEKNTLKTMSPALRSQLMLDIRAPNLYELLHTGHITDKEYKHPPVITG